MTQERALAHLARASHDDELPSLSSHIQKLSKMAASAGGADDVHREANMRLGEPTGQPLRQLKVDVEDLAFAFENTGYELQYFLDLETGETAMVTDETHRELERIYEELSHEGDKDASRFVQSLEKHDLHGSDKDALLLADQVERGFGTRYHRVPTIDSHEAYGDMQEFIDTVEDERLQQRLWVAIRGRGAFRRFKDVLLDHPQERERWFRFKDEQMRRRVLDWLKEEGIQPIGQGG